MGYNSHAAFAIIVDDFLGVDPLVLRDLGPWDQRPTITNDAEQVVRTLVALGRLTDGRKLYYYDSEGELTEILVKDGEFAGFKCPDGPVPGQKESDHA